MKMSSTGAEMLVFLVPVAARFKFDELIRLEATTDLSQLPEAMLFAHCVPQITALCRKNSTFS